MDITEFVLCLKCNLFLIEDEPATGGDDSGLGLGMPKHILNGRYEALRRGREKRRKNVNEKMRK